MRHIDEVVVHCSATAPNWLRDRPLGENVAEILRWHVNGNGWRDIGYHLLINRDGDIGVGRPVATQGAHTRGRNATTIGVCLIGGRGASATDDFHDHFTSEQDAALRKMISDLMVRYPGIKKVSGHNEYANKGCSGFRVRPWFNQPIVPDYLPDVPTPSPMAHRKERCGRRSRHFFQQFSGGQTND